MRRRFFATVALTRPSSSRFCLGAPCPRSSRPSKRADRGRCRARLMVSPICRGTGRTTRSSRSNVPPSSADKELLTAEEAAAYAKKRLDQFLAQPRDNIHYDDAIWQAESYSKDGQADVARHCSARRQAASIDDGREEARGRSSGQEGDQSVGQRADPVARRAMHHVGQCRAADGSADL